MFLNLDPELQIVGESSTGLEALELCRKLNPDVVLMDWLMPEMDGISATTAIRNDVPETGVLALTSFLDNGAVIGAIKAGAIGYLLKDMVKINGNTILAKLHLSSRTQVALSAVQVGFLSNG